MKKKQHITSYSANENATLRNQAAVLTNWEQFDRQTEAELEASLDDDSDVGAVDWSTIEIGIPQRKQEVHIRLDSDLLEWLKQDGRGYQTRINAILRSYMKANAKNSGHNHTS